MKVNTASLETVCGVTSKIPDNPYPEIVFAGRSNVGKSSLINVLLHQNGLAHTSSSPGKTQTINFYLINHRFYLVDLPGYGYAAANLAAKAQWGEMIERYLLTSRQLRSVFLLMDIRRDPGENDRIMYDWIRSAGFSPVIIATKADKVSRSQVKARLLAMAKILNPKEELRVLPFSSLKKEGEEAVWAVVDAVLAEDEAAKENGTAEAEQNAAGQPAPKGQQAPDGGQPAQKGQKPPGGGRARKPRWKQTGKPTAKKTKRMQKIRHEK